MIYLLFSIVSATGIMVVFKLFDRFEVNTFQAIVMNYWAAALLSFALDEHPVGISDFSHTSWYLFSILLGLLFIGLFYLFGLSTKVVGASVTTVAAKMSLVVPVCYALFVYSDSFGLLKVAGVVLALISVYLIAKPATPEPGETKSSVLLPVFVFMATGFADTFINYIQKFKLGNTSMESFSAWVFVTAALTGTLLLIGMQIRSRTVVELKSIFAGLVLAIPNYFSLIFLLKALQIPTLESSVVIPVNNMSIVALTTLAGVFIFREKLSFANRWGLLCCFGACLMILFSGDL